MCGSLVSTQQTDEYLLCRHVFTQVVVTLQSCRPFTIYVHIPQLVPFILLRVLGRPMLVCVTLWGIVLVSAKLLYMPTTNLQMGDTIKNLKLKETLLTIRNEPTAIDAFYKKSIADSIIAEVSAYKWYR